MPSSGASIRSGIGPDDASLHPGQIGQASPLLFTALIDDAAMFPPGDAPLERALLEHRSHRAAAYSDFVGPLLLPAAAVPELAELVAAEPLTTPLRVGIIAPEGLGQARDALLAIDTRPDIADIAVVAVELPLESVDDVAAAWSELGAGARAVWWEIDREGYLREQLGRLAGAAKSARSGGAKLRTGGITAEAFPPESWLAAFLRHAIDVDLTFKLTAGLHHAVRCTGPDSDLEQHGVVNILCAIRAALNGAEEDELETLLAERDPAPLVTQAHAMSEADASVIRAFWASFGCCGVTEPITELAALGLLPDAGDGR